MTNPVTPDTDDLDAFEELMYAKAPEISPEPEEVKPEDSEPEDDALATEDDESQNEPEAEDETDPEPEPEPEKPKKSRFQERIDDLTTKAREAERRELETQRRLNEALERLEKLAAPKPEPETPAPEARVKPAPDAENPDGTPKYPLGEFDPSFISDLLDYTLKVKTEELEAEAQKKLTALQQQEVEKARQEHWENKTKTAEEKMPDYREKVQALLPLSEEFPAEKGTFIANTVMSMDYGPEILYLLADDLPQARAIMSMNETQAAIALGRLEARFALQTEEKQNRLKVSNAPPPPERTNRGTSVSKAVTGDEDDLEVFEKAFFKKKRL